MKHYRLCTTCNEALQPNKRGKYKIRCEACIKSERLLLQKKKPVAEVPDASAPQKAAFFKKHELTEETIFDVAKLMVTKHLTASSACDFLLLDQAKLQELQRVGSDPSCEDALSKYTYDTLRKANAQEELNSLDVWLNSPDQLKSSNYGDFLKLTKARFRKVQTVQIQYEISAIMHVVKSYVDIETFAEICGAISRIQSDDAIRLLDAFSSEEGT